MQRFKQWKFEKSRERKVKQLQKQTGFVAFGKGLNPFPFIDLDAQVVKVRKEGVLIY